MLTAILHEVESRAVDLAHPEHEDAAKLVPVMRTEYQHTLDRFAANFGEPFDMPLH